MISAGPEPGGTSIIQAAATMNGFGCEREAWTRNTAIKNVHLNPHSANKYPRRLDPNPGNASDCRWRMRSEAKGCAPDGECRMR